MVDHGTARLLAYGLAGLLLVVAGWKLLSGAQGREGAAPVRVEHEEETRRSGVEVYVHVAGAVRRPGLYRVPRSARVAVALERAGGPSSGADLAGVNLAAAVQDGQQIIVPRKGASPTPTGPAGPDVGSTAGTAGSSGGRISLSSATVAQLDQLDGIGPTLARRIIEYRDSHGGFRSVGELKEVDGIGEKRFAALKDAVRP